MKIRKVLGTAAGLMMSLVGTSAFAENYSYKCVLNLPLQGGYGYEYVIKTDANYDSERVKLIEIMSPNISVYLTRDGVRKETYVLDQPLQIGSMGDRFAVLDYKQAAISLNARMSFLDGPSATTAKVYHVYQEGSRVSTTETEVCEVTN